MRLLDLLFYQGMETTVIRMEKCDLFCNGIKHVESFAYMSPCLWNTLPKEINSIGEMSMFKSKLAG